MTEPNCNEVSYGVFYYGADHLIAGSIEDEGWYAEAATVDGVFGRIGPYENASDAMLEAATLTENTETWPKAR